MVLSVSQIQKLISWDRVKIHLKWFTSRQVVISFGLSPDWIRVINIKKLMNTDRNHMYIQKL